MYFANSCIFLSTLHTYFLWIIYIISKIKGDDTCHLLLGYRSPIIFTTYQIFSYRSTSITKIVAPPTSTFMGMVA